MNVRLTRREGSALPSARRLFATLAPALGRSRFWFVRKAPDLRLRLPAHSPREGRRLAAALAACRRERVVARWFFSTYEPEVFQFGGPRALPLVHRYFAADSLAWLAWDRLTEAGATSLTPSLLSAGVLNDLFVSTVDGPEEVWDVWCNLARMHEPETLVGPAGVGAITLAELAPLVSPAERRLLARQARANRALATGLGRLWGQGLLGCGLRAILPFVALFHWNRFGLGRPASGRICAAMMAATSPKRGLRGASV